MGEKYIQDFGGEIGRKTYVEYIDVYGRIILSVFERNTMGGHGLD